MAANQRFSTAIEVLVLMATEPDRFRTSQALAKALSTNPVVVRRLLADLSRAGIVTSTKGPSGGSRLSKGPKQITLRDIYRALGKSDLLHRSRIESAEVQDVRSVVRSVFRRAEKSLERELDSTTLNQLIKKSGRRAAKTSATSPQENAAAIEMDKSASTRADSGERVKSHSSQNRA